MRRIEIDDDVYAELERHVNGFEQPNDVLRRLLVSDGPAETHPNEGHSARLQGRLLPLIEAGLIQPGDELSHRQTRKGRTFRGSVGEGGAVVTERGVWPAPSPALARLVGSQIDGWANWVHVPTGKTLRELRSKLPNP